MPRSFRRPAKVLLLAGMGLAILTCGFTALNTLLSPWTLYGRSRPILAAMTLACLALLLVLFRFSDRHNAFFARHERAFLAGAAAFYFICQMLGAQAMRFVPNTDVEQVMTAAQALADTGTFAASERSWVYFTRYPHNLGIVYLLSGVFRGFGALGWADRFMQAVLAGSLLFAAGLLAAARVARRLGGTRAEARMLILMGSCLPMLYCTTEIYTDAFSLPFAAMILYCAFRSREAKERGKKLLWLLALALLTFLGAQIRFPCLIVAIACLIWLALDGELPLAAAGCAALCVCMLAGGAMMNFQNHKYLPGDAIERNKFPKLHYIAMGLPIHEDQGYGQYGDGGWLIFSTSFDDPAERDEALKREIIDRVYYLRYPNRLLNLLSRKNLSTFGDGTFGFGYMIASDVPEADNAVKQIVFPSGKAYNLYYHLCTALFAAQLLLAALACGMRVRRGDTRGAAVFITLVGAFLFLSMWETRARYFFQFMEVLLLAGAMTDTGAEGGKP